MALPVSRRLDHITMSGSSYEFELALSDGSKSSIRIIPEIPGSLCKVDSSEAAQWCEAEIQLIEGYAYEYNIPGYLLKETPRLVRNSRLDSYSGRLTPTNYVGTLSLDIIAPVTGNNVGILKLEVRSIKMEYREHYRTMLCDIADKCNELLLQAETPLSVLIEPLFSGDSKTLYQRFAFLRSMLDSREFNQAINKVISNPVSAWEESIEPKDIRGIKRFSQGQIKQLCSSSRRYSLPEGHALQYLMPSLPTTLFSSVKTQTLDTPENRFVKHALNTFLLVCVDVKTRALEDSRLSAEASILIEQLEQHLSSYLFKEQSPPRIIPLNSPILQRKEGYREVFRAWLMHDLASRVTWEGGEDVYEGGKKDVAILYEYWVYFKLLDVIKDVFKIEPAEISTLLSVSPDKMSLDIKRGKHKPIEGVYQAQTRLLNIDFSYNRTWSGGRSYPNEGSWTRSFRPDYTLSIWPCDNLDRSKDKLLAEQEETIVHIHFDAKYRVENLKSLIGDDLTLPDESSVQPREDDLLKMHAYRDAIRRTGGAYIIYPGNAMLERRGFHEIIPGLGAFPLNPGFNATDPEAIKSFLREIADHVVDRATQREKIALKSFQIYKDKPTPSVYAVMPTARGENRDLNPDETSVLITWYKSPAHLEWILKQRFYNIRIDLLSGSLHLDKALISARYMLLHSTGELTCGRIIELSDSGPLIRGKDFLTSHAYPDDPSKDFYLIYKIDNSDVSRDFGSVQWDITQLRNYRGFRFTALPFTASLTELMNCRVDL